MAERWGALRRTGVLAAVMAGLAGPVLAAEPVSWPAGCADVALVLSIDASGSIDDREFDLQMRGYADAFRSDEVHLALRMAGIVDVAVVVWGDPQLSAQILPFRRIGTGADAHRLAAELRSIGREVGGNTGLARGIQIALDLLADPAVCAERLIVDVSGDGREKHVRGRNADISLPAMRARAESMGVTVNALAIATDDRDIADYFERNVTVGHDAFVQHAATMDDFAAAIIEKLRRELLAGVVPGDGDPG